MIFDIIIGEQAFILQNVINENAVTARIFLFLIVVVVFHVVVIAALLEYLTTLVDDSLMEIFQVLALLAVLIVARR